MLHKAFHPVDDAIPDALSVSSAPKQAAPCGDLTLAMKMPYGSMGPGKVSEALDSVTSYATPRAERLNARGTPQQCTSFF